jgi:hypothetical protein
MSAPGSGTITVVPSDAPGAAQKIPVTFSVFAVPPQPPLGVVDTPAANASGVFGSLAITGWAIHDIGVTAVQIWRDPVAGESTARILVGNATLVDGARPDIEAAFAKPFQYRTGWGYMLLTNMLPNRGNGTFTLHVVAVGADGSTTTIGSRTIVCDNAHADRPFGAIDTPVPGSTVSGSAFVNFGWALTSNPAMIPRDGSTLQIFVDGVKVGSPAYDQYRGDIAFLFPGLANSNGAVGYFVIDTTTLTNGVHTIAWLVSDNLGHTEGIGSRYFSVLNTGTTSAPAAARAADGPGAEAAQTGVDRRDLGRRADDLDGGMLSAVVVRHGFDATSGEVVVPDTDGTVHVNGHEVEPLELVFGDDAGTASYAGYLVVDGTLRALPTGATLDSKAGVLHWHPGPGFVGSYEFLLVKTRESERARTTVRVTIVPRAPHDPHGHGGR